MLGDFIALEVCCCIIHNAYKSQKPSLVSMISVLEMKHTSPDEIAHVSQHVGTMVISTSQLFLMQSTQVFSLSFLFP
jgi:hypothetical protein